MGIKKRKKSNGYSFISGEKFTKHIKKLFKELGLTHTYLDENEPIIPHRARHSIYVKTVSS